jgi:hypothetical protein
LYCGFCLWPNHAPIQIGVYQNSQHQTNEAAYQTIQICMYHNHNTELHAPNTTTTYNMDKFIHIISGCCVGCMQFGVVVVVHANLYGLVSCFIGLVLAVLVHSNLYGCMVGP